MQNLLKEAADAAEVYFPQPVHQAALCKHFGYQSGVFPQAELASQMTLAIPLYPEMTTTQFETVIVAVEQAVSQM